MIDHLLIMTLNTKHSSISLISSIIIINKDIRVKTIDKGIRIKIIEKGMKISKINKGIRLKKLDVIKMNKVRTSRYVCHTMLI